MGLEIKLNARKIRKICKYAQYRKNKGDDAIYCECAKGSNPPSHYTFMSIKSGEICIATNFFSTGHTYYNSDVNAEKMRECKARSN